MDFPLDYGQQHFNRIRHGSGWGEVRNPFSVDGGMKRYKVLKPVDFGYGKNFRTAKDGSLIDDQLAAPNVGDIIEGEFISRTTSDGRKITGIIYTKEIKGTRCGGFIPIENLEEIKEPETEAVKSEEEKFLWMPKKTGQMVAGAVVTIVIVGSIILIIRHRKNLKTNNF